MASASLAEVGRVLLVYVHVLCGVFLAGHALFWTLVSAGGTPRDFLARLLHAPWPPRGLPSPVRLPLHGLAWAALFTLAATGVLLRPDYARYGPKLLLVALVCAAQTAALLRPGPLAFRAAFGLTLAAVAISPMTARA